MVEFTLKDYRTLLKWFELAFAKITPDQIGLEDRRTFWKLSFLCEDLLEEQRQQQEDDEDE